MTGKNRLARKNAIEIFSTPSGVRAIDSPVRLRILSMLRGKEMSFDDIVADSGKVKSTISVHLRTLLDEGVIGSRADPDDARKKFFFINSSFVGDLSRGGDGDIEKYVERYSEKGADPFELYRLMFGSIRVALIAQGVNIDPVLHEAGVKVGNALYPQVSDDDTGKMLGRVGKFWLEHRLGKVEPMCLKPVTINVYDCFECAELPFTGKPACAFESGILEAIFSAHFKNKVKADEVKCYAMGDGYCRFVIST
jgi:uncharacterized protein